MITGTNGTAAAHLMLALPLGVNGCSCVRVVASVKVWSDEVSGQSDQWRSSQVGGRDDHKGSG